MTQLEPFTGVGTVFISDLSRDGLDDLRVFTLVR